MNVNDIIEVNELARVKAGAFKPASNIQHRMPKAASTAWPMYIAARRRYDPSAGGITSQINNANLFLETAITGEYSAGGFKRDGTATSAMARGDIVPMAPFFFNTTPTQYFDGVTWAGSVTGDMTKMMVPIFAQSHGTTYQSHDTGNYTPQYCMFIPVRNEGTTDVTIPANWVTLSGASSYRYSGVSLLVAGAENPALTDTPTITNLVYYTSSAYNVALPAFTLPARRSALLVIWSHSYQVATYSNSHVQDAMVGPHARLLYEISHTDGLIPDVNTGIALMLGKASVANSYSELFVNQIDTYNWER